MGLEQIPITIIFFILVIGFIGYSIGKGECNDTSKELIELKENYTKLNESYNQEVQKNIELTKENELLRENQRELTEQIASYLVEQTAIDLVGLKKYDLAYDLIKIVICNKIPTLPICY